MRNTNSLFSLFFSLSYPILLASALIGIVNPIILWFFTKIRYLDRPQEPEIEVLPTQEVIEVETQKI